MNEFSARAPDGGIRLTWRVGAAGVVVTVAGDVDMATAPQLDAGLAQAGEYATATQPLMVDMRETTFLGSAGLRVFTEWHQRCAEAGSSLVLAGLRRPVANVLRITGLDRLLTVIPSVPSQPVSTAPDPRSS